MSDNPQGKKYQKSKMGLNLLWLHNRFKKTHIRSPTEFVAEMQFDVYMRLENWKQTVKAKRKVSLLELDRVYPNLKTRRVLVIFTNPNLKKTQSLKIAKTCALKDPKIETQSNPFLNYSKFCQKRDAFQPNFGHNFPSNA